MRRAGPDAATLLARRLTHDAAAAGVPIAIGGWTARPWSSATFAGSHHDAILTVPAGIAADRWLAGLPRLADDALVLRGHRIAELAVARDAPGTVALQALTIDG